MIYDTFMFWNELDMLECRLTELDGVVDKFVLIECGETHQGAKKPSVYLPNADRFRAWASKIEHVWVDRLEAPDPFGKEHEQRERTRDGLIRLGIKPHDIVIHSDIDEIPAPATVLKVEQTLVENAGKSKLIAFNQRMFCFAVDWEHPCGWQGPVAARYKDIKSFTTMRNSRQLYGPLTVLYEAGHHMSWLGGPGPAVQKLGAFLHAEMAFMKSDISSGRHSREGYHVDGAKLSPVTVDRTWPKYVWEKKCPASWFRAHFENLPVGPGAGTKE